MADFSEHKTIDLVEYGELRGQVAALQLQVAAIIARQEKIDGKLDGISSQLSEAKGGWRTMMMVGGAASSLGAGVAWIVSHLGGKH